jgi:hypothetical protein
VFSFFTIDDPHLSASELATLIVFAFPRPERMAKLLQDDPSLLDYRLPGCRFTLLEAAVRRGFLATAQVIYNASPEKAHRSSFPVHWLAYAGNIKGMELFEKFGFAIDAKIEDKSASFEVGCDLCKLLYSTVSLNVLATCSIVFLLKTKDNCSITSQCQRRNVGIASPSPQRKACL